MSITNILNTTHETIPFKGEWYDAFGEPERTGIWFVWGQSGNGKSEFAFQLCAELCKYGRVLFNSLEEKKSLSFKRKVKKYESFLDDKKWHATIDTMDELNERLQRKRSADFIIIDSFQQTGLTKKTFDKLKEDFPNKLFIFLSQADGKQPRSRAAKSALSDSDQKIFVEGFIAKSNGRFIGSKGSYTIWEDGAWMCAQNKLKDK